MRTWPDGEISFCTEHDSGQVSQDLDGNGPKIRPIS